MPCECAGDSPRPAYGQVVQLLCPGDLASGEEYRRLGDPIFQKERGPVETLSDARKRLSGLRASEPAKLFVIEFRKEPTP